MRIDYEKIGKRIKDNRKRLQFTQATLAEITEVSDVFISNIETGVKRPSMDSLEKIADALEIDIEYLMFGNKTTDLEVRFPEIFTFLNDCNAQQAQAIIAVVSVLKEF
ncbi:hypothetical protein FACS189490_07160 [Clostridia bacterium]|nr:hypothetical protein FACS189490_07160 [Clostridia bacterium]